ncbi:ribosomal protein S12 methylthiotransferase RimO [Chlorobiota bacterium]|nr:ribosomal protein S12 methylthiotransferase RimO [Chlorobiota bacterium]
MAQSRTTISQKVSVITLGCSKNTVDSEVLSGHLKAAHLELTDDPKKASSIIINTCGFIDLAKEESVNTILEAAALKRKGKIQTLIVAGCLSERYGEELRKEIPEVDHFFGTEAYGNILKVLSPDLKYALMGERVISTPKHYAYIKISEGCDNPCSFCAIPLMRGKHRSKQVEDIVREAQALTRQGVKEIILVAQDSTAYGLDIYGKRSLDVLLRALSDVSGAEWIRLMYAYPTKFPKEILPVIAERDNICSYIDMPLQHISTNVLKSMRRGITRRATEELIHIIKDTVPDITLRTTFIVGYPGETEQDFAELCEFVSNGFIDRVGVFTYSQEDDTYAYILGDPIAQEVKDERRTILMDIQKGLSLQKNQSLIGTQVKAIVEQEINGEYQCRTESDAPEVDNELYVRTEQKLSIGDFITVEIDDTAEFDLFGHTI